MQIAATLAAAILLADFVSGLMHWWEDRYGNPDWPLLGEWIVKPNMVHHADQMAFTRAGYWQRNWTTLAPALVVAAVCWRWPVCWMAALILSQANEIHAWSHMRCSRPIRFLQKCGALQSPSHHAIHHRDFGSRYCVITPWLNPMLDLFFWRALERIIKPRNA